MGKVYFGFQLGGAPFRTGHCHGLAVVEYVWREGHVVSREAERVMEEEEEVCLASRGASPGHAPPPAMAPLSDAIIRSISTLPPSAFNRKH